MAQCPRRPVGPPPLQASYPWVLSPNDVSPDTVPRQVLLTGDPFKTLRAASISSRPATAEDRQSLRWETLAVTALVNDSALISEAKSALDPHISAFRSPFQTRHVKPRWNGDGGAMKHSPIDYNRYLRADVIGLILLQGEPDDLRGHDS